MPARIYFIVQVISFEPKIASLVDHFFVIFAKSCSFKKHPLLNLRRFLVKAAKTHFQNYYFTIQNMVHFQN